MDITNQERAKNFLGGTPLIVSKENQFYVDSYLYQVKKRSDFAYLGNKSVLKYFFEYIDKSVENIKMLDVRNYFDDVLDKEDNALSTKKTKRSRLTSFFYHVQSILLSNGIDYNNPVPNQRIYQFTKKSTDIKKQSEKDKEILSMEQITEILNFARKNMRKKEFIKFGLLISSGARIGEILTLKVKNINLEESFFETGFEKNARKSTRNTNTALLFFFPNGFKTYLKNYILSLDKNVEWLFPSSNSKTGTYTKMTSFFSHKTRIEKALGFRFKIHSFRKTLITNRVLKMKCPLWISEGLVNHKSSSVEGEHYIKLSIEEKREQYDKYFPYQNIPYF